MIGIKIGHDMWIIFDDTNVLCIFIFFLKGCIVKFNEGIIIFIYIIVVIELEITSTTIMNNIISAVLSSLIIVFNFGINPSKGGTPIRENKEIIIFLEKWFWLIIFVLVFLDL